MNICFLIRTFHRFRGGIETYTYHMARFLSAQGHRVHIITQKGEEKFYKEDLGPSVSIHQIDFKHEPFPGYWRIDKQLPVSEYRYARAVAQKIDEIERKHGIDVIETPAMTEGFWHLRWRKTPFVVRLHGYHGLKERYLQGTLKNNPRKYLLWQMERELLQRAAAVAAVSQDFAGLIKEIFECPQRTIEVVPNGVDPKLFKPDGGLREPWILFVGRLQESKGIGVLAQAIPEIIRDFPDVKFLFAGRETAAKAKGSKQTWKDYLLHTLPKARLVFLGQLSTEELIPYYQKSRVAVFPSLYEPGGIVALEAIACGCPMVASNIGGFAEAIRDGEDGLLIPVKHPQALAAAVKIILQEPALAEKFSRNGLNRIKEKFDLERLSREMVGVYEKAIAANKNRKKRWALTRMLLRATIGVKQSNPHKSSTIKVD